ncbi:MAG: hypothetical protein IPK87_03635 [Planctomycetes bacterium]|nr:hypothetical protein [Planctomycetota bacterium]
MLEDAEFLPADSYPADERPPLGESGDFADPDGTRWSTNEELIEGRTRDGRLARLRSHLLYMPWEKPIPGGPDTADDKLRAPLAELIFQADLEALQSLRMVESFHLDMVTMASGVLRGGEPPGGMRTDQVLRLGQYSAREVPKVAMMRRALMQESAKRACEKDIRDAFMWDRAHAVVANTLLAMDKQFTEVGFGSWMPFRFPDQWLMFCGVMRRVLAANGLIHAKNPDVYRRLLEETPFVKAEEDEGVRGKLKLPHNWSSLWTNRGAQSMQELYERMSVEIYNKLPQQKRQWEQ